MILLRTYHFSFTTTSYLCKNQIWTRCEYFRSLKFEVQVILRICVGIISNDIIDTLSICDYEIFDIFNLSTKHCVTLYSASV